MNSKVRPNLINLINSNTSDIERFQNEVLRPIIKMQNNLLVAFFKNYIKNNKIKFNTLKAEVQENKINTILTKDINFKNILIGSIIGHLEENEIEIYFKYKTEINKRIIQIIKQRLHDNFIIHDEAS
ncbi:glyoxalase [Flavobacteriaceae bacterium]|nr:glyoxalase [Flavobacteriaceae bacterium]MDB3938162.1 glyoxalase [Flavobacteriaceae bacterium]RPG63727.1 MAG: glyoxalase [Flavobacteriaceae bacterium TMED238]RZO99808.1 MAG: glyoxalase [Flavobacteriales bacterium]|tara:strand:+ start:742 stop:1122 length:381 start_codon:yes stop_codon:yes gene_type:complete